MTLSPSVAQLASLEDFCCWRDLQKKLSYDFQNKTGNTNTYPVTSGGNSRHPFPKVASIVLTEPEPLIMASGGYIMPTIWTASSATLEWPAGGGLYPPPQIPCGVHVESRSIPGVHVDFRHFFLGGSPANFLSRIHVESSWTPVTPSGQHGLHLGTEGI